MVYSLFQYISCYSLSMQKRKNKGGRKKVSIHLMLLFILFRFPVLLKTVSFNTSHVTLYPSTYRKENGMKLFQYISCYSLSYVNKKDKSIIQMFQYISCYSLSKEGIDNMKDVRSFNTSHVTLYPSFYRLFFF